VLCQRGNIFLPGIQRTMTEVNFKIVSVIVVCLVTYNLIKSFPLNET